MKSLREDENRNKNTMQYNTRVLILKNQDYRETDRLITVFTENKGKITAVARGVKKPNSSLRALTQPFVYAQLSLHSGKQLDLITQGKLLDFFANLRQDTDTMLNVIYILELLDKALVENYPLPGLFNFSIDLLNLLNEQGLKPMLVRFFEMRLLKELGFQPQLSSCAHCQNSEKTIKYFNFKEGGGICDDCAPYYPGIELKGETRALLNLLLKENSQLLLRVKPSAEALKQLEYILEKHLEYHLERRFAVPEVVRKLKQRMHLDN